MKHYNIKLQNLLRINGFILIFSHNDFINHFLNVNITTHFAIFNLYLAFLYLFCVTTPHF